ncbi:hypothetical protein LguiB_032070 [Lonicera macranthoides]
MSEAISLNREFFGMAAEEKAGFYCEDFYHNIRLYTSGYNYYAEDVHYWKDTLKLPCNLLESHLHSWPHRPHRYREVVGPYTVEVTMLTMRILELIGKGLGLEAGYFKEERSSGHGLVINYYPPCPEPSLALGIRAHCDAYLITLIQQNNYGLQITKKDGEWVGVDPLPNAFVVMIANQLQLCGKSYEFINHVSLVHKLLRKTRLFLAHPGAGGANHGPSRPCVACAHSHKRCPLSCDYARIFPNVIDREDYHTIFSVFGVRNVASFLQRVPEDRLFEAISSYLLEATARIENPVRGCTALLASFEQKVEELQARVTALEARLGGGSSCVNPLCSFAPPGGSSRFFSSVENNVPNVIPTAVNLSKPIAGGFLRLLMSEEGVQNIPSTSTNLVENGAPLTEMDWSYDQAALDAVYQGASNNFLSQSALDDFVADFAETTGTD